MKKIKFFALAIMAMLSINAFAAAGDKYATTVYRYAVVAEPAGDAPGTAQILGFVAGYATASMATTAIPATVAHPTNAEVSYNVISIAADAFAGNENITALDFTEAANLTTIPAGAFIGTKVASLDLSATKVAEVNRLFTNGDNPTYATLTSVSLPATVTSIAASAFEGCTALNSVTFADFVTTPAALPNVTSIGAGAFKKTALTALDLTKTKITTLNELFENVNTKVTEIKLPKSLTTIAELAFDGLSVLESIDFSACEEDITINASAFKNTMALTTLSLPEVEVTLVEGTFAGSYVTTVTFNGNVVAPEGSFQNDKLATINFMADLTTAGSIESEAFKRANTTQKIIVNYSPSWEATTDATFAIGFDKDAFKNAAVWVTFNTSTVFGTEITKATGEGGLGWSTEGANGVKVVFAAITPDPTTIKVYSKGGASASFYYGTWYSGTKNIKIAKKQDGANVMVYGAYVDNASAADGGTAILMDQLMLIGGSYYVPAGTPVVVKSSKNAEVVYTESAEANSTKKNAAGTAAVSQIIPNGGDEVFAKTIKDAALLVDAGYVVYFLAPIETYGFLWSKFKDNTVVAPGVAGGFYIYAKPAAAADRLNVIWLDGSEEDEVTAIKAVKTAAEKGAIYNLAGQKVNASYKGVVIKDGKKYIQK